MVRLLIFLLGMLTTRTSGPVSDARLQTGDPEASRPFTGPMAADPESWRVRPDAGAVPSAPRGGTGRSRRRRRIPLWVKWTAVLAVVGVLFRKAVAFAVVTVLSAALHLFGFNVHLPKISFAWPWQVITSGSTTSTYVGPWVLQRIEGIAKPALGTETFNFVFTHKVSKSIGPWPCWYSSTFYAVGHASATVDLNPGPAWWKPGTGHYQLEVLARPAAGKPGRVTVAIVLPRPQLPQSVHGITVDNTLSRPLDTQHSWTYPGLGCGALIQPQFSDSVLYAEAQSLAFDQATRNPQVTGPLISSAEGEAGQMIRNNFIQPTLNALGYTLTSFTLRWS
jgi:hypothetical protein